MFYGSDYTVLSTICQHKIDAAARKRGNFESLKPVPLTLRQDAYAAAFLSAASRSRLRGPLSSPDLLCLPDRLAHRKHTARRHRQFIHSHLQKSSGKLCVSPQLSADPDPDSRLVRVLYDCFDQA